MLQANVIGNLGQEPKCRVSANGRELMTFSVAVTNKDKSTTWLNIVANKMDGVLPYLTKGRQVFISGDLELKTYKGEVDATIFANVLQLCGRSEKDEQNTPQPPADIQQTPQNPAPPQAPSVAPADADIY